jgi:hypothetical protein
MPEWGMPTDRISRIHRILKESGRNAVIQSTLSILSILSFCLSWVPDKIPVG